MHTKDVHIFREVLGVKSALIQQLISAVKEIYLDNIL